MILQFNRQEIVDRLETQIANDRRMVEAYENKNKSEPSYYLDMAIRVCENRIKRYKGIIKHLPQQNMVIMCVEDADKYNLL